MSTLWIAQMGKPKTDRAFDTKHKDWKKLAAKYVRTRSEKDLAKLPLKEGLKPRMWALRQLGPESYAAVSVIPSPVQRAQQIFALSCHQRREANGTVVDAKFEDKVGDGPKVAEGDWVKEAQGLGGHLFILEASEVALRWSELGDLDDELLEEHSADPFALFALPRGVEAPF